MNLFIVKSFTMKNKWNLLLCFAFLFYILFAYLSIAFTETNAVPERVRQTYLFYLLGSVSGVLILPPLLPLRELRAGKRPSRYKFRLFLTGLFFLPNIIVRIMGPESWLESQVNYMFMAFGNGIVLILVYGLFFTLSGKNRFFWALLPFSIGLFAYNFAVGPGQSALASIDGFLFYSSGFSLFFCGIFLFLFLIILPKEKENDEIAAAANEQLTGKKKPSANWVFLILAGLVVLLVNHFTERMYIPIMHTPSVPGFNPNTIATIITIIVLPFFSILANLSWRRFLEIFSIIFSAILIFSPVILFLGNSQPLFFALYLLGIIGMMLFQILVPFAIIDVYWNVPHKRVLRYFSWFLAVSFMLFRIQVQAQAGLFKRLQLDNSFAVLLLSSVGIVFFVLMWWGLTDLWNDDNGNINSIKGN